MSAAKTPSVRRWLVCEPEPHWVEAVYRFAPAAVAGTRDALRVDYTEDPRAAVRRLTRDPTTVVLWSPPGSGAETWFRSLRELAATGGALQMVGLRGETSHRAAGYRETVLALQQLGAACVLERFAELPRATRWVRRFWATRTEAGDENPLRRVWQSLPWD